MIGVPRRLVRGAERGGRVGRRLLAADERALPAVDDELSSPPQPATSSAHAAIAASDAHPVPGDLHASLLFVGRSGGRRDGGFAEVAGPQQVAPAAQVRGRALEHEPSVAQHVGAVGDLERERRRAARRTGRRRRGPRRRGAGSAAGARRSPARARGSSRRRAARAGRDDQRAADGEHLLLAARQHAGLAVEALAAARAAARAAASRRRLPLASASCRCSRDGQAEEQRAALGHERRRRGARACASGRPAMSSPSTRDACRRCAAAGRRSSTAWSSCRRRWARAARRPRRRATWRSSSRTTGAPS